MERVDSGQRGAPERPHHHWWQRHDREEPSPLCVLEDQLIGADYYANLGFLPPALKVPTHVD
jgi:hypothetical protein